MFKCLNCGIEFEANREAKTCSPKCRKDLSRINSVTDNVTLSHVIVTDKFEYTVPYYRKPGDAGYDHKLALKHNTPSKAKYWYDVPIAGIPVTQKGWPKMPDYMNGRQYFLWRKNEFKEDKNGAIIHNPFPEHVKLDYVKAGEGSRRWGTV